MVRYKLSKGASAEDIVSKLNSASRQGYDEMVYFGESNGLDDAFLAIVRGRFDDEPELND